MGLAKSAGAHASWRADIDGLRAVAVLAVLGYHFFPGLVQAGFIGVDIFFVISGYLITRILLAAMDEGRFSVTSFYARRVRRIFPALVLVLATVMLAAWLFLYDEERAALGRHILGGAGFVSNLVLWRESGYFNTAIESKPLAHLWSLGVEEQFYILWPLLLAGVARSRQPLRIVAVLLAASLLACGWMVQREQPAAFYVPVFRFWELLAGAVLVLAERKGIPGVAQEKAGILSLAGFALLAIAFILVHSALPFPGWWAVLPVAGTCFLIAAGPQAAPNRVVLSSRPIVWIGLVSFPLYLWHWPLLALARIVFNGEPNWRGMLLLMALSFLLAWLTWRWAEAPMRAPGAARGKVGALVAAMVVLAVGGVVLQEGSKLYPRGPDLVRQVPPPPTLWLTDNPLLAGDCRMADPSRRQEVLYCMRDARGPERLALVGDSKAEALYEGLVRTSSSSSRWLFIGGSRQHSSVLPIVSDTRQYARHQAASRLALRTLTDNQRIETVVIAAATRALFSLRREDTIEDLPQAADPAEAREGFNRFVGALVAAGKNVVLMVDNPTLPDPRRCLATGRVVPPNFLASWFSANAVEVCRIELHKHLELSARYRALLEEIRATAPDRITIFDTLPFLCDTGTGACGPTDGRAMLYSYTDHISGHAARKIGTALNDALARGL